MGLHQKKMIEEESQIFHSNQDDLSYFCLLCFACVYTKAYLGYGIIKRYLRDYTKPTKGISWEFFKL
jgi:hypothetical protein